jgi:hypothetical protein
MAVLKNSARKDISLPPKRKFFELDKVPDGLIEGAKRRLAEVFDERPVSDTW